MAKLRQYWDANESFNYRVLLFDCDSGFGELECRRALIQVALMRVGDVITPY